MNVPESAKYMDKNIAMGMDIFFFNGVYNPEDYKSDLPTNYNFNLIGNTSIINNLYDEPTYSALGVELNFYFYCADNYANRPTVTLKSDDPLTIYGGARGINTDGNLVLDLDLNYTPVDIKAYTIAIYSTGLTVTPNHTLNITSNGGLIESNGDVIFEDGTTIVAESTPTQAHNEWLGVAAIAAAGDIKMSNAKFDFTSEVVANKFIVNSLIRYPVLLSNQNMKIKDSNVNIDVKYTGESPRGDFAANLAGLYVNGRDYTLTIDNSNISVAFDAPEVINVAGISSLGAVNIIDSVVDVDISGRGQVLGVSAQDLLTVKDSNINSNVAAESYPASDTDEFAGIAGRPVVIDLSNAAYKIHSKINQGTAFVSADKYPIPTGADQPAYDVNYTPSLTKLNGAEILLPEDGVLSSYTYGVAGDTILYFAETPYSLSDTSAPALDVVITVIPKAPDTGRR